MGSFISLPPKAFFKYNLLISFNILPFCKKNCVKVKTHFPCINVLRMFKASLSTLELLLIYKNNYQKFYF